MGAGRKKETIVLQSNPYRALTSNGNLPSARNLRKKDLAGVIFGCKKSTYKECVFKQIFGLPALHFQYVQNITPGMPLFLFNYTDRTLHGIFEAASPGQMYINRYAWTLDGEETTPFPAQVRVNIRIQCQPLSEDQFKPILERNYFQHEPNHFWFELDHAQTQKLISLFSASPASASVSRPPSAAKWETFFKPSVAPVVVKEHCSSQTTNIDVVPGPLCHSNGTMNGKAKLEVSLTQDTAEDQEDDTASMNGKRWSSLFKPQLNPLQKKECEDSNSKAPSTMSEDETPILSKSTRVQEAPISTITTAPEANAIVSQTNCLAEAMSTEMNAGLRAVVVKLIQNMVEIKELQSRQTLKIQKLEQELEEANSKLRKCKISRQESGHSGSSLSARQLEENQTKSQDLYHSILLVGGFDGSSWLQNLDCYSPVDDNIQSLTPMKSVRSYASAVELNRDLYVLGGGCGSSWYDTVESYNLQCHLWVTCPSLSRKIGSLAGASLLGKIFAIGGGNASDCFSEVEVLDLSIGRWMATRSMVQKRFAPAAADLNGVLYVAGGFDGFEYLSSAERYDPRTYSWTRIKSMSSRRGCHSLCVLNEKLYAIGGFDGAKMVPTVEVFEPRVGSWIMSEPMTYARGYMGAVTFEDKIYAIGGMEENSDLLGTVECYSEGQGWKLTKLKSVGKRCFFSAVAVRILFRCHRLETKCKKCFCDEHGIS